MSPFVPWLLVERPCPLCFCRCCLHRRAGRCLCCEVDPALMTPLPEMGTHVRAHTSMAAA